MARIPLNDLQLEILTWIRDGTPDGVYEDYRPRIVARALHNRGLADVSGHGASWQATLTTDGAHYLEHGDYPPSDERPEPTPAPRPRTPDRKKPAAAPRAEPKPRKPPRVGPTDAMMNALTAAEDHRIEIEYKQVQRYRQLALTADRFKKIPDGMQVTVSADYRNRTAHVTLEPLPEWRTRILDPVPVPGTLRNPSDVIKALRTRDDLDIRTAEKNRALRLVEALVVEARRREYTVAAVPAPRKDRWGYVQRTEENAGHIKITLGPDEYRLSIYQLTEKVEHVATKSELARAGRGYALPKWDYVPTGRLGIRIDSKGGTFWGDSWTDRDDRPLDDALAQILQELELRHDAAVDRGSQRNANVSNANASGRQCARTPSSNSPTATGQTSSETKSHDQRKSLRSATTPPSSNNTRRGNSRVTLVQRRSPGRNGPGSTPTALTPSAIRCGYPTRPTRRHRISRRSWATGARMVLAGDARSS